MTNHNSFAGLVSSMCFNLEITRSSRWTGHEIRNMLRSFGCVHSQRTSHGVGRGHQSKMDVFRAVSSRLGTDCFDSRKSPTMSKSVTLLRIMSWSRPGKVKEHQGCDYQCLNLLIVEGMSRRMVAGVNRNWKDLNLAECAC
jgi:hypothetical protein